jgi:putative mycofactocin binding protein MftB
MAAAGIKLHPSCRVREERFGLLFYDCKGPRLLFAATGTLLPADYFETVHARDEFPPGTTYSQKQALQKFVNQLLEKGFLHEQ